MIEYVVIHATENHAKGDIIADPTGLPANYVVARQASIEPSANADDQQAPVVVTDTEEHHGQS